MYSLSIIALIIELLPLRMHGAFRLVAMIEALCAPLKATVDGLPLEAATMLRQARWNGQRAIMQAAINEVFPDGLGLILVETSTVALARFVIWHDAEGQPPQYIWFDSEGEPPRYVYTMAELSLNVDFTVKVPTGAAVDFDALRRFVLRLKLAGKRFEIINY